MPSVFRAHIVMWVYAPPPETSSDAWCASPHFDAGAVVPAGARRQVGLDADDRLDRRAPSPWTRSRTHRRRTRGRSWPCAVCPSRFASPNRSPRRAAPSSIEYSVWTCRCAKSVDVGEGMAADSRCRHPRSRCATTGLRTVRDDRGGGSGRSGAGVRRGVRRGVPRSVSGSPRAGSRARPRGPRGTRWSARAGGPSRGGRRPAASRAATAARPRSGPRAAGRRRR